MSIKVEHPEVETARQLGAYSALNSEAMIANNSAKAEPYADKANLRNVDAELHLRGRSFFIDDIPLREGTLHAVVYGSPKAHGRIRDLDLSAARKAPGVVAILTSEDITGENQIGSIIQDEPLMAIDEVHFIGMPVALVVAESRNDAERAIKLIKADIEELPVITEPRDAYAANELIMPSRTFNKGDTDSAWASCAHVFENSVKMGGQEHLYLETQGAYVCPLESGNLQVFSSTQAASYVQKSISKILGLPMHRIEVDVRRLGGGFGGKEDQANHYASLASLAAYRLDRPVKLCLSREEDLRMTGKRHPYDFDYKIGFDENNRIVAYEIECYQNAGAAADMSPAIMERSLFHGGGSYYIPNARIRVHSCRTNLPPNTAFRGFGAPQTMYALEAALEYSAHKLGIDTDVLQKINLLREGDEFPYGMKTSGCNAVSCFETAEQEYELDRIKAEIRDFNSKNDRVKKGYSVFPLCFGISFTKTPLNQAGALVHIFKDGSISVTTGVVEMGQSVNTKILQVAATMLKVSPRRIRIEPTNTGRVANASPTAASSGADLNGKATELATAELYQRLIAFAREELGVSDSAEVDLIDERIHVDGKATELDWETLIMTALERRVNLSCHAHYKTPRIHFDKETEKGLPFSYHVYGTAITVVKMDCLRGTYELEAVKIVHDFGTSINLHIDLGQVEGALLQGIGLMSIEELIFNADGSLNSDSLSSYKVPDIYGVPADVSIKPLPVEEGPELAIFGSKAVGEPPLCYGIGTYFAALNAIRAYNPSLEHDYWAPMTYQKTMLNLYKRA